MEQFQSLLRMILSPFFDQMTNKEELDGHFMQDCAVAQ
jgi:hypothetical protein